MKDKDSHKQADVSKGAIEEAHEQAEKDIKKDPDLSMERRPGDDLDEGELARLEGED
ncbi:MAG: hypothetical protein ABI472_07895 [Ginsengibacter sp.]